MTPALSITLATQADRLHQLAHLVSTLDARLGNALILQATQLALASLSAKTLERDLVTSQRTADELAAEMVAEPLRAQPRTPDTATRQRYSRIIAGILDPTSYPGCHLGRRPE